MRLYQIISRLLQATVLIIFILAAVLPYVAAWTTQAAASTADFAAIEAFVEQQIHDLPIPGPRRRPRRPNHLSSGLRRHRPGWARGHAAHSLSDRFADEADDRTFFRLPPLLRQPV
jgi:hypothetical protein